MPSTLYSHVRAYLALRGWVWDAAAGLWLTPDQERHACDAEAFRWYMRAKKIDLAEGRLM